MSIKGSDSDSDVVTTSVCQKTVCVCGGGGGLTSPMGVIIGNLSNILAELITLNNMLLAAHCSLLDHRGRSWVWMPGSQAAGLKETRQ